MKQTRYLMPWIAALVGIGITLFFYFPGYMSQDSAYQWWQVRHQTFDPAHPIVMVAIWRITDLVLPGPGGYFVFQSCLYWLSVAAFVCTLPAKPWLKTILIIGLGFWPPLWGLSLHIWKDIGTMSFFCLAAAFLSADLRNTNAYWRLLALLCIVFACAYRHNALSAGSVFIVYLAYREVSIRLPNTAAKRSIVTLASACLILGVQALILLPGYVLKLKNEPLWPLQAQWDIAAVSVGENQLLFPAGWSSPKLNMAILRRDFDPSVNVPVFKSSLIYINPYYPMSDHDFSVLKKSWLRLPIDHPKAYWSHRWYVCKNLFGWIQDSKHPNYVFAPGIETYKDNPKISVRESPSALNVQTFLSSLTESPLFYGWAYLFLAVGCVVWSVVKRNALAMVLAGSAVLYVLPLIVLAPSCDFRYLSWLLQGTLLAFLSLSLPGANKQLRQ